MTRACFQMELTFVPSAANGSSEPSGDLANSCCVRTQHENPRRRREIVAASQRRLRSFTQAAANLNSRIHTSQTKRPFAAIAPFPSRFHDRPHVSMQQCGRLVRDWVSSIGLDPCEYGTHSMRRTKAALIYRKTGDLRAVQLLLGHTKVDSTVRYLGVELEDALRIAEKIDI